MMPNSLAGTMSNWFAQFVRAVRPLTSPRLHPNSERILAALATGSTLKSHRNIDGDKQFILHHIDGTSQPLERTDVDSLKHCLAIDSNKKFPAETYLLTQRGQDMAMRITQQESQTLSARNF